MRLVSRLFRLVWGGDVDRALRPVLAVSLAGSIAGSAGYPFIGIWALRHLHAGEGRLAFTYLLSAMASGVVGYVGGHLSDRLGRRPLILAGWGGQALCAPALFLVGTHVWAGLAVAGAFPALGALGNAADQAIVADLVPPERHESAYASVRVASNLGVSLGPPLGGLLLIGSDWSRLWLGVTVLAVVAWAIGYRYVPSGGHFVSDTPPRAGSLRIILRDRPFLLFMASSMLATMTYIAYETLLPISITTAHGISPATWGFLVIVNPIFVTFLQLRLTQAASSIPAALKLGVAMPLMGVPFLLLDVGSGVTVVLCVVVLFVIGEMLWVPTSQAVVAALAPADLRGTYMGVFGSSWSVGWALTPFLGLQVRHAYGDSTMWVCVAVVGVLAGVFGLLAVRGRDTGTAVASPA
ncbi:MAG TPA: MFS transporter [Gaiellaceae bacterium]|nr:MFS transporter [Gaiellaceae bacterium]